MTINYNEKSFEELLEIVGDIFAEISERGYTEGYEEGKRSSVISRRLEERNTPEWKRRAGKIHESLMRRLDDAVPKETQQQVVNDAQSLRDHIVEQAKADVKRLTINSQENLIRTKFIINREKRTIVCLLECFDLGYVIARGIAKCAPGDCFNVHIGKAIAVIRALGLEVPAEYLNAPQPTEVRVGDVVKFAAGMVREIAEVDGGYMYYPNGKCNSLRLFEVNAVKIIDDSREIPPKGVSE